MQVLRGRFFQIFADSLADIFGKATFQIGQRFVVEDTPDDTVIEGEFPAGGHVPVLDVEEPQVGEYVHVKSRAQSGTLHVDSPFGDVVFQSPGASGQYVVDDRLLRFVNHPDVSFYDFVDELFFYHLIGYHAVLFLSKIDNRPG